MDACRVTKPTLYYYFGSKRGLLDEVLHSSFKILTDAISQAAEYNRDITRNLSDLAGTFFRFAGENREFYRMQLAMYFAPPGSDAYRAIAAYNEALSAVIETMFRDAVTDHGNMRDRQKRYAATFLGMINTCIGLFLNGYAELDDNFMHKVVHQFMHGIFS